MRVLMAPPFPSALLAVSRCQLRRDVPSQAASWTRQRPDRQTDKQDLVGASPSYSVSRECPEDAGEAAPPQPRGPDSVGGVAEGSCSAASWGPLSPTPFLPGQPTRHELLFRVNGRTTLRGPRPCSDGGASSTFGGSLSSPGPQSPRLVRETLSSAPSFLRPAVWVTSSPQTVSCRRSPLPLPARDPATPG